MSKQVFVLNAGHRDRARIFASAREFIRTLVDSVTWRIEITRVSDKRTAGQNRKMWAMLGDISRQIMWTVNGVKAYIEPEDWKDLITAGLAKHQRIAQGIEGGVVMLGSRTSQMDKKELAELIEYIYWFGADRQVEWVEARQYVGIEHDFAADAA